MPDAVLLSVTIGVGGCGWPSSSRVMRSGTASFALWKRPAHSASAALESTSLRILQGILMAPFMGGCSVGGLVGSAGRELR